MLFPCLYPLSSQNLSNLISVLVNAFFQSCGRSGLCPLDSLHSLCVHLELQCSSDMIPPAEVLLERAETKSFPVCNVQAVLLLVHLTVVHVIFATA